MNKVYVDVVAEFRKDGQLVPIFFTWEDGRKYSIDRILKIERCASRKAGGVGMMYTCMIQGQESHLFYEVDKWFMERKRSFLDGAEKTKINKNRRDWYRRYYLDY